MVQKLVETAERIRDELYVPPRTRPNRRRARRAEPDINRAVDAAVAWLCHAQDRSRSRDGGVPRHFSIVDGWSASSPEATGCIVPTLLQQAHDRRDDLLHERSQSMLDWLVAIQHPDGGFQDGTVETPGRVSTAFSTGQILLGLASGVGEYGSRYRAAMRHAADWLLSVQDADGCWRTVQRPFTPSERKTYYTHVAWGLLEAARLEPAAPYADAALANVRWALGRQRANGWLDDCCFGLTKAPLTHTIGYALRGLVEAYRFSDDEDLLRAARRTADGLLGAIRETGFLPGRLDAKWRGTVTWACLTGSAQIACCWLLLYQYTGDVRYRDAAYAANRYLRQTLRFAGGPDTRGSVKGSHPISGGYARFEYLSWATRFFIDANRLEQAARGCQ